MVESERQSGADGGGGASDDAYDPAVMVGKTIAGRYEITRKIGRGGMGVVFLASQSALSRDVVIKLLAPNLVNDQAAIARFEREARGLSRLQHPNVVTIFDFGRDQEHAYIAMEYVQGETLSRYLKRNTPLSLQAFATISVQILKGIGEAHKLGLIHRDVKPANIMLCEMEGRSNFVKILDFGLAKLMQNPTEVTKEQHLVGSAAFLAPEQILDSKASPRSDVYAIGVLFYLMLAGRRPFQADNDAILLYKHVNETAPPLVKLLPPNHDVPGPVIQLVESCLAKDPEERPADANELLEHLNQCLGAAAQLPWVTGEFRPVTSGPVGLSNEFAVARPTTGRIRLEDLPEDHTPSSPATADTLDSLEISRSLGGQSVVLVQQGAPKRNMLVGAVIGALVIGIVALLMMQNLSHNPAAPDGAEQTAKNDVGAVLDQVGGLIEQGQWGKAELVLESVQDKLGGNPDLLVRVAGYTDQIEIGRLLASVRRLEAQGEFAQAIVTANRVLERDPSHAQARELIQVLSDKQRVALQKDYGVLAVRADRDARVFIDGRESGPAPISIELPPGTYDVRVQSEGFAPHVETVHVGNGEKTNVSALLAASELAPAQEPRSSRRRRSRASRRPAPDALESVEHGTESASGTSQDAANGTSGAAVPRLDAGETGDQGADDKGGLLLPIGSKKAPEEKRKDGLLLPVGSKH